MFCLTCYRLWPSQSVHCGNCGRTFRSRICSNGHKSPMSAQCCTTCGDDDLTQPTAAVQIGCLSGALSIGILLLAIHFVAIHIELLLGDLWSGVCWFVRSVLGVTEARSVQVVDHLFGFLIVLMLLSRIMPSSGRSIISQFLRILGGCI